MSTSENYESFINWCAYSWRRDFPWLVWIPLSRSIRFWFEDCLKLSKPLECEQLAFAMTAPLGIIGEDVILGCVPTLAGELEVPLLTWYSGGCREYVSVEVNSLEWVDKLATNFPNSSAAFILLKNLKGIRKIINILKQQIYLVSISICAFNQTHDELIYNLKLNGQYYTFLDVWAWCPLKQDLQGFIPLTIPK